MGCVSVESLSAPFNAHSIAGVSLKSNLGAALYLLIKLISAIVFCLTIYVYSKSFS